MIIFAQRAVAMVNHFASVLTLRTDFGKWDLLGAVSLDDGQSAFVLRSDFLAIDDLLLVPLAFSRWRDLLGQALERGAFLLAVFNRCTFFAIFALLFASGDGNAFIDGAAAGVALLHNAPFFANFVAIHFFAHFWFASPLVRFFDAAFHVLVRSRDRHLLFRDTYCNLLHHAFFIFPGSTGNDFDGLLIFGSFAGLQIFQTESLGVSLAALRADHLCLVADSFGFQGFRQFDAFGRALVLLARLHRERLLVHVAFAEFRLFAQHVTRFGSRDRRAFVQNKNEDFLGDWFLLFNVTLR